MTTDNPNAREKLLKARAEIEGILLRYDIAGFVVLHAAPTSSEVILHLEPSYSVVKIGKGGDTTFSSKLEDYNGDKEAKRYDLAATANMTSSLFELAGRGALHLGKLSRTIDEACGVDHGTMHHIKPN
jgi:hypothetical protein